MIMNEQFKKKSKFQSFVKIPGEAFKLNLKSNSISLLSILLFHKDGYRISQEQLMEEAGVGRRALESGIKQLVELNIIKYKSGGLGRGFKYFSNYYVNPVNEWKKAIRKKSGPITKTDIFIEEITPYIKLMSPKDHAMAMNIIKEYERQPLKVIAGHIKFFVEFLVPKQDFISEDEKKRQLDNAKIIENIIIKNLFEVDEKEKVSELKVIK